MESLSWFNLFLVLVMLHASFLACQLNAATSNDVDDYDAAFNHALEDAEVVLEDILARDPSEAQRSPIPVVLWHGMGDTCCGSGSIGYVKKFIEQHVPGIYVISLKFGKSLTDDFENSYFMNVNDQIEEACKTIRSDPNLRNGYNGIGFSQGGQFIRALAQRCSDVPAVNIISFGGQHQGVYGLPRCPGENQTICNLVRRLIDYGAYADFVQRHLVQAQYWHDPIHEDEYREKSIFLADINNEIEPRNETYKTNLLRLKNFVMIKFADDTIVDPRNSEWFGFYAPGQAKVMIPLQETRLYKEDWLGLKQLDEQGKLKMLSLPGDHMQIDMNWMANEIIAKYLWP